MDIEQRNMKETVLVVLARSLLDELRPGNYLKEWSAKPLSELLPSIFKVLDLHSKHLGNMIKESYENTTPSLQAGNINQLDTLYPEYFGKTQGYYQDSYNVQELIANTQIAERNLSGELSESDGDPEKKILTNLALAIVDMLASLTEEQENEHRTLERFCQALAPVFYAYDLVGIGFDLGEYADQWRELDAHSREKLRQDIISRW